MVNFLLSVENVFVVFKEFSLELGDDSFQESWADLTEKLISHFSNFDIVGDLNFHVLDKFGEAEDILHGRKGI